MNTMKYAFLWTLLVLFSALMVTTWAQEKKPEKKPEAKPAPVIKGVVEKITGISIVVKNSAGKEITVKTDSTTAKSLKAGDKVKIVEGKIVKEEEAQKKAEKAVPKEEKKPAKPEKKK